MPTTSFFLRRLSGAFGLALAVAAGAAAQQVSLEGKTAGQVYKNIQVIQDAPADQVNISMHNISGQLGVECLYCHVGHGADLFPLDDKPAKDTARKMMRMVAEINKSNFQGRQVVTCYTCHQGRPQPVSMNILPLPVFIEHPEIPEPPIPSEPTVDQILAKYVQALGGEQAIRKVTSRVVTATHEFPTGPGGSIPVPALIEQYRKAPNLILNVDHTPTYAVSNGFDGTTAWTQDMTGLVADVPFRIDQMKAKRNADFYESVNLKQEYQRLALRGVERVKERQAYVVYGYAQGESPDQLYFDTQNGLLIRKIIKMPTLVGDLPVQEDYDDYRDTGSGVKYPFWTLRTPASVRSEPQTSSTIRVQKVEDNVSMENTKFVKPQSKPAPK